MKLLLGFMVVVMVLGLSTRTFDWRGYMALLVGAVVLTGAYYLNTGTW